MTSKEKEKNIEDPTPAAMIGLFRQANGEKIRKLDQKVRGLGSHRRLCSVYALILPVCVGICIYMGIYF